MIITTTNTIQGREIIEYIAIVSGEVIAGINFFKDLGAGIRNIVGGRSKGYEEEIINARKEALFEVQKRAEELGADAIVGCKIDYEVIGEGMLMVTVSGTAVSLR